MDARIQFRVNEETKNLAQLMAESQGRTVSSACRDLIVELAEAQRKTMTHDIWLSEQINAAFDKFENGKANFVEHSEAKSQMETRKMKIRNRDRA